MTKLYYRMLRISVCETCFRHACTICKPWNTYSIWFFKSIGLVFNFLDKNNDRYDWNNYTNKVFDRRYSLIFVDLKYVKNTSRKNVTLHLIINKWVPTCLDLIKMINIICLTCIDYWTTIIKARLHRYLTMSKR